MKKIVLAVSALFFWTSTAHAAVYAAFGQAVNENRELANKMDTLDKTKSDNVVFYSEIKDQQGDTITHIWKKGDEEIYRQSFQVNGPRWRVWSSMSGDNFSQGDNISVQVQDQNGENLYMGNLGVAEANAPTTPTPENMSDVPVDNVPSTLNVD